MKGRNWDRIDMLIGVFSISFLISLFLHWYSTGSSPLGWDTPKYIHNMLVLKEAGLRSFLKHSNYEYLLYSFLGASIAIIFRIDPYYIVIYYPILLAILLMFMWYHLARKWYNTRIVASLTLFLTIAWYSLFDFPIFRQNNLLGFILSLYILSLLPDLFEDDEISKKRIFGVWSLFLLGGFSHPHTLIFFWGILFLTSLFLLISNFIRRKVSFIPSKGNNGNKVGHERRFFLLVLLFGFATFIPVFIGVSIGEGTSMIYRSGLAKQPLSYYQSNKNELFVAFGGFLAIFFFYGLLLATTRGILFQRMKETILFLWILIPILTFLFSFRHHFLVLFARRSLLSLPLPMVEAIGIEKLMNITERNLDIQNMPSPRLQQIVSLGIVLTFLIPPMVQTEVRIYDELNPARRYISEKTVQQLKWIRAHRDDAQKPVFVIFTSVRWTASMVSVWDDWLECYIRKFYIYPDTIEQLEQLNRPRTLQWILYGYYNEMRKEGVLNHTELANRSIYVLPEFYRHGTFGPNETKHLTEINHEIYLLQINKTTER